MNICPACGGQTKTKFCNKSCAATFNNRGKQRNKPTTRTCRHCEDQFTKTKDHSSTAYCIRCLDVKREAELKRCPHCREIKSIDDFYPRNRGGVSGYCKICTNTLSSPISSQARRDRKLILVEERGGKCLDCGFTGPPFMFDFDHRNPEEKENLVGKFRSLARMREEAAKCDLVCSNCHRLRTHKQRCGGCKYCLNAETTGVEPALTP